VTLVTTAVALAGYIALLAYQDRRLDARFRDVAEGATKDEVVALLGMPDARREGCRDLPTWMNKPVFDVTCAEEIEFHAGLRSELWTVGFDARGRAIAKYRYLSR
jgi:hypothetical protein